MARTIANEIDRFDQLCGALLESPPSGWGIEQPIPGALEIFQTSRAEAQSVDFTLLGTVHGNETVGIATINEILSQFANGTLVPNLRWVVAIGNRDAAKVGRRFIERDLNRSFACEGDVATAEARRARELETLLGRSRFLLDLHQTREPSETPFFIFPFTRRGFFFAVHIDPNIPIVTHWAGRFSRDGICSDEFVNSRGGTGITIELGQAGMSSYQIGQGFWTVVRAMEAVARGDADHDPGRKVLDELDVYTMASVIRYAPRQIKLRPGLRNFAPVTKGEIIAQVDGADFPSPEAGKILFPKYYWEPHQLEQEAEVARVIRSIDWKEIPAFH